MRAEVFFLSCTFICFIGNASPTLSLDNADITVGATVSEELLKKCITADYRDEAVRTRTSFDLANDCFPTKKKAVHKNRPCKPTITTPQIVSLPAGLCSYHIVEHPANTIVGWIPGYSDVQSAEESAGRLQSAGCEAQFDPGPTATPESATSLYPHRLTSLPDASKLAAAQNIVLNPPPSGWIPVFGSTAVPVVYPYGMKTSLPAPENQHPAPYIQRGFHPNPNCPGCQPPVRISYRQNNYVSLRPVTTMP